MDMDMDMDTYPNTYPYPGYRFGTWQQDCCNLRVCACFVERKNMIYKLTFIAFSDHHSHVFPAVIWFDVAAW